MGRRVAVIGGGITGLAAAYRLRELAATHEFPLEVTLLEAGDRVGGALHTLRHDGLIAETGADSFLSEKPAALRLAERLGLADRIVRTQERFRKTLVVRNGELLEVPEGFSLLAPTYLAPILRSPIFTLAGKARLMLEPLIPRRRSTEDESLAAFVTRRLGSEVLDRVAQPLAAGIYTADPYHLSAAATVPRFVEMERRYGSLIRGLRSAASNRNAEARGTSGARWSLFVSFDAGVGTLIDALKTRLDGTIRYSAAVAEVTREGNGWRLTVNGATTTADAVVCAAPAYAAADLLDPVVPMLAAELRPITYASAAVVNLAYPTSAFPSLPIAFGFVVPAIEQRKVIAGSFSSLKFTGRAPARTTLIRLFLGGALHAHMMDLDDSAMLAAAREELRTLLDVSAEPEFAHVRRWPNSMPQYGVGHLHRVQSIHKRAAGIPNLFLAGAYLDGVGIPDCVRHGESAAEAAFAAVTQRIISQ